MPALAVLLPYQHSPALQIMKNAKPMNVFCLWFSLEIRQNKLWAQKLVQSLWPLVMTCWDRSHLSRHHTACCYKDNFPVTAMAFSLAVAQPGSGTAIVIYSVELSTSSHRLSLRMLRAFLLPAEAKRSQHTKSGGKQLLGKCTRRQGVKSFKWLLGFPSQICGEVPF